MRWVGAALVCSLFMAGAVFAQDAPPDDGRFRAEWEVRGNAAQSYPDAAIENGVTGAVEMCCSPRPDRGIDCRVGFEWPTGFGFGEASLRIARTFRMSEASYAAFQSDPNNWMQIPIRYRVGGISRERGRVLESVTERTLGLCGGPDAPVS